MSNLADRAVDFHDRHFNCSQSVFAALAPQYGFSEELALKLASPFGGGFSRMGHVCGAVTGALLALGLAHGADTPAGKDEIYRQGQEFIRRFEANHGSLLCRTLIGKDISTPEGWEQANATGVFQTVCPLLVRDATELIQSMLAA